MPELLAWALYADKMKPENADLPWNSSGIVSCLQARGDLG